MQLYWPRAIALLLICATPFPAAAKPVSGPGLIVNFDPTANYGKYHRYKWVPRPIPSGVKASDYERVRASIDRALASRGFAKSDEADFAIAFTARPGEQGEYLGSYRDNLGWAAALSIDIYDASTKLPIWHGMELTKTRSPVPPQVLDRVTADLISNFPPSNRSTDCPHQHPGEEKISVC